MDIADTSNKAGRADAMTDIKQLEQDSEAKSDAGIPQPTMDDLIEAGRILDKACIKPRMLYVTAERLSLFGLTISDGKVCQI